MDQPVRITPQRTAYRLVEIFTPLLFYCLISVFYFATTGSWRKSTFGVGTDPPVFAWCLNWWPFAIRHGLNLFQTQYVWFPQGFNLTWCTSIPFLALITAPATAIFGPAPVFNVLTLAAPALAAWTAYLLMRELTGDWRAALPGGYLFGFSSYELGQLEGHLNLDSIFLVPVVILLCVRRFKGKMGLGAFIAGLCVMLLAQMGISTEILATLCVLGALACGVLWLCAPSADRLRFMRLALDIGYAALPTAILASPFLFYLFKGLSELPAEINSSEANSGDLVNLIIPNLVTRLGSKAFFPVYIHFLGGGSEQELYLGLPLIVILVVFFHQHIARPHVRALLAIMCGCIVFSFGPRLHIAGTLSKLQLPWAFMQSIPLMHHVLPDRLSMYTALATAIAAALWLADAKGTGQRLVRWGLAGAAIAFLIPDPSAYYWTRWPSKAFFTPQHIEQALGLHKNVLMLPFTADGMQMAGQLNANMIFTQSGGYIGITPQSELKWNIVPTLLYGFADPDFQNDFAAYCVAHKVDFVLIGPGTPQALVTQIARLHWPHRQDGDIDVVRVPGVETLRYYRIAGDYWHGEQPLNWMGKRVEIITRGEGAVITLDGHYRIPASPVTIEITGGYTGTYVIGFADTRTFEVPANSITVLTASDTFVASKADGRAFSIFIGITPVSRSGR